MYGTHGPARSTNRLPIGFPGTAANTIDAPGAVVLPPAPSAARPSRTPVDALAPIRIYSRGVVDGGSIYRRGRVARVLRRQEDAGIESTPRRKEESILSMSVLSA